MLQLYFFRSCRNLLFFNIIVKYFLGHRVVFFPNWLLSVQRLCLEQEKKKFTSSLSPFNIQLALVEREENNKQESVNGNN